MGWELIPTGLTAGSIFALVALGFNVILRPTNVFNFAQGDFAMVGAIVFASLLGSFHLPWFVGLVASLAFVAVIALVENIVAVAPILKRSAASTGWVITTLGVSFLIENIVGKLVGGAPRVVSPPPGLSEKLTSIGPVQISTFQIFLILFTVAVMLAIEFYYGTPTGKAIRAVAEDREAALLRGINPRRLTLWSFAAGGVLAAIAGVLAAPLLQASPTLGSTLLISGFEAAAVGGVGNNRGALVAGYVLGFAQAFSGAYLAPGYQSSLTLGVMLFILLFRPNGIFGTAEARVI